MISNNNLPAKTWKRILYEKQHYKDNYVDPIKFLDQLNIDECNKRLSSYWSLFLNASIIVQQFNVVVIFLTVYKYVHHLNYLISNLIAVTDMLLLLIGCIIQYLLNEDIGKISLVAILQTMLLFGIYLRIAAPVLRTLTSSFSEDTIHALAITFSTIHLVFHDYAFVNNAVTKSISGTLSLNAAMFTSIILVSRLNSSMETVVVFLLLAVILFILFPNIARLIKRLSLVLHLLLVLTQWIFATYLLFSLKNKSLFVVYELLIVLLWLIGPYLYYRVQVYKKTMKGPWDIAYIE